MSRITQRYLLIGGVLVLIVVGQIIGAIRPYKHALGAPPVPPPTVEVVQVQQEDVPIYGEWIGTLDGFTNADVRAQVTGYLLKQGYQEGTFVKQGRLLFQIDPRPFQAGFDQAQGQLAQAKAILANAQAVRRRLFWAEQRLLQPHGFADWHLVLWCSGEPADFYGWSPSRESATGQIRKPASSDRLSANDPTCFR